MEGKQEKSPCPEDLIQRVRDDLRIALKNAGMGDGLPKNGGRVQHFEVRLIQSLLKAFEDPDEMFGDLWGRGVYLGSQFRKLPRTPGVFDRKVKWKYAEATEPLHGEWQSNCPSLREHASVV